jgi:macrolide transport system ATP-binding/permease protein
LGRGLEERDTSSPRVAVVTEQFAKKFFPGENPVGRRIGLGGSNKPADIEIVGVAKTTLYNSVKETETPPVAYVPYTRDLPGLSRVHFELRIAGNPLALVNAVRQTVHQANAGLPVSEVSTQDARIDQTISQERTFAYLCACFAALALAIACVGLYGTTTYAVARRTSEIGIRMALGASQRDIVNLVLNDALWLVSAGILAGLPGAFLVGRLLKHTLFNLQPTDPITAALSLLILGTVAAIATWLPASRAARIDPMTAIREE